MPQLDRDSAREWIRRWDLQQEQHLPDREERFTALIDAVEEGTGRPDPVVIDLGCGPGSLSIRLLDRIPAATIVESATTGAPAASAATPSASDSSSQTRSVA